MCNKSEKKNKWNLWIKSIVFYNKDTLLGIISKAYKIHGTNIIKAITKGKSTVQQNDINWSNLILGKDALAQIKIKIITQVFSPKVKPPMIPSVIGS